MSIVPFYLSFFGVNKFCKLVIKYGELIRFTRSEGDLLKLTDVEALKYRSQIGLGTLVAYTLNDEY